MRQLAMSLHDISMQQPSGESSEEDEGEEDPEEDPGSDGVTDTESDPEAVASAELLTKMLLNPITGGQNPRRGGQFTMHVCYVILDTHGTLDELREKYFLDGAEMQHRLSSHA